MDDKFSFLPGTLRVETPWSLVIAFFYMDVPAFLWNSRNRTSEDVGRLRCVLNKFCESQRTDVTVTSVLWVSEKSFFKDKAVTLLMRVLWLWPDCFLPLRNCLLLLASWQLFAQLLVDFCLCRAACVLQLCIFKKHSGVFFTHSKVYFYSQSLHSVLIWDSCHQNTRTFW